MLVAWTMATFAGDSAFQKRSHGKSILCAEDWLQAAGVTSQAGRLNWTRQVEAIIELIARRQVPSGFGGVVRHWRLIEKTIYGEKVAAAHRPRSDEIL